MTMLISRSFLRGFGRGLAAPGLLFEPYAVKRNPRYDASVERAWEDVGSALRGAMSAEDSRIGKKTKNTRHQRRSRQAAE